MAPTIEQAPFVKQLAANDKATRDQAVLALRTFLAGRHDLPPLELLKLWKGLFYCVWMSDRPRTQQQLCDDLAGLVAVRAAAPSSASSSTTPPLAAAEALPFLRAFWLTMAREWTNIDVLRMDKFLLLTRRYVAATWALLRARAWDPRLAAAAVALLEELPLNAADARLPNGMRLHVVDIYVDELARAGALGPDADADAPRDLLLRPLRRLAADSPTKVVRQKCTEALADARVTGEAPAEAPDHIEEGGAWEGFGDE